MQIRHNLTGRLKWPSLDKEYLFTPVFHPLYQNAKSKVFSKEMY